MPAESVLRHSKAQNLPKKGKHLLFGAQTARSCKLATVRRSSNSGGSTRIVSTRREHKLNLRRDLSWSPRRQMDLWFLLRSSNQRPRGQKCVAAHPDTDQCVSSAQNSCFSLDLDLHDGPSEITSGFAVFWGYFRIGGHGTPGADEADDCYLASRPRAILTARLSPPHAMRCGKSFGTCV